MRGVYPLRDLPRQGQIWSWVSYDVANQSFTLLINTLLFPLFFQHVVVHDPGRQNTLWSLTYGASYVLTVLASPLLGAVADARAWKKAFLIGLGFGCALLTCLFGLIQPGQLWLAALLYIPANFAFSVGENFLASFLPELTTRENFGRLSGFSWGVAYAAALLMLLATAGAMVWFGLAGPDDWRPFFVASGVWFFAFATPTLLFLRERPAGPAHHAGPGLLTVGFVRLGQSLRHIRRHRDLLVLLVASLFYGTGMNVVVFFASILAVDFGFRDTDLVLFVAVITLSGVVGTILPTLWQDRLGHRRTTIVLLVVWVGTSLMLAAYAWLTASAAPGTAPRWPIWLAGNLMGLGMGSLGSANRAFVGFLTPASRSAEVFGVWGLVFKLAVVLTIPFAVVKDVWGPGPSFLVLAGFLIVGLVLTLLIDEGRGARAAAEADGHEPVPCTKRE